VSWGRQLIDLILYSNLWIALGAAAMYAQTQLLLSGNVRWTHGVAFVFFGTLSLYAFHRIIGLSKFMAFVREGRYQVIYEHRHHIITYGLLAGLMSLWHLLRMPWRQQLWIVPAAVVSGAYVVPWGKKGRRLRDFGSSKIFFIAFAYTWLTVWLPAVEWHLQGQIATWLMLLERFTFLFAITVPFDLRDRAVDLQAGVYTLPVRLGPHKAIWMAEGALAITALCVLLNAAIGCYPFGVVLAFALALAFSGWWIWLSPKMTHDYYFTGLLDGTMILQFGLVWCGWYL